MLIHVFEGSCTPAAFPTKATHGTPPPQIQSMLIVECSLLYFQ